MIASCVASSLAALNVLRSTLRWLVRRALAAIILLRASLFY